MVSYSSAAGSKHRNKFFYVGIVIQAAAMIGIALGGGSVFMIVIMIACYNIGNQFVESVSIKCGHRNRSQCHQELLCRDSSMAFQDSAAGLFALITPMLVAPERIQITMYGFAGIVIISAVAGSCMLKLQRKHGIGQMK